MPPDLQEQLQPWSILTVFPGIHTSHLLPRVDTEHRRTTSHHFYTASIIHTASSSGTAALAFLLLLSIHSSSTPTSSCTQDLPEPIPAVLWRRRGHTLDKPPVHHIERQTIVLFLFLKQISKSSLKTHLMFRGNTRTPDIFDHWIHFQCIFPPPECTVKTQSFLLHFCSHLCHGHYEEFRSRQVCFFFCFFSPLQSLQVKSHL